MTISDAIAVLRAIDDDNLHVEPEDSGGHWCFTTEWFRVSNGWQVALFCDGGFDYVETVVAPDGTRFESFEYPHPNTLSDPSTCCADCALVAELSVFHPKKLGSRWGFTCEVD